MTNVLQQELDSARVHEDSAKARVHTLESKAEDLRKQIAALQTQLNQVESRLESETKILRKHQATVAKICEVKLAAEKLSKDSLFPSLIKGDYDLLSPQQTKFVTVEKSYDAKSALEKMAVKAKNKAVAAPLFQPRKPRKLRDTPERIAEMNTAPQRYIKPTLKEEFVETPKFEASKVYDRYELGRLVMRYLQERPNTMVTLDELDKNIEGFSRINISSAANNIAGRANTPVVKPAQATYMWKTPA